ncbi:hypothetical protein [Allocoleopsis franciscana]|uniref:Uncharacterized protein n=1 Tax=Allocoleopsis franciscana PCC 7113 TaxID=1173027 RepID=K9WNQ6_9CYAN|nr:hypothetical protein [Allocoleopsis franciscana]AFZ22035.1 hypothetical protein Mic7113_6455 [Allocoleopsis franciscana PCC 7113]
MAENAPFPDLAVKLRKVIQVSGRAAENQLRSILQSLEAIADKLESWAKPTGVIGNSVTRPNLQTVKEVSEAIDELLELFIKLEKWLEKRDLEQPYWSKLLEEIPNTRRQHLTINLRNKLGTYYRWRNDIQNSRNKRIPRKEELTYEEDRLEVASKIMDLSENLRNVVEKVSETLEF